MVARTIGSKVEAALGRQAAVGIIGPRQVGKTTLAHAITETRPSTYLGKRRFIGASLAAKRQRGFYNAVEDIQPAEAFVVHAGEDRYPISEGVEAVGLREMVGLLSGATTDSR
jgi:ATPase subunit of ABC transporter with duplicated ATPase domains